MRTYGTATRRAGVIGAARCWRAQGAAFGADRTWINSLGGTFSDMGNWQAGLVAGIGDEAIFGLNNTYTVTFTAAVINAGIHVRNGDVTFGLGGFNYGATSVTVGEFSMQTGRLTVQGGTLSSNSNAIGLNANSTGFVTVTGVGAAWNAAQFLTVANNGTGTFTVSDGATARHLGAGVGFGMGTTGAATVTGAGSLWQLRSGAAGAFQPLTVGQNGAGSVLLDDDAEARSSTGTLGNNAGSQGTVTVSDGAEWNISDGPLTIGAAGTGDLMILSGGAVNVLTNLRIGNSVTGDGELVVDGAGSRIDIPGTGAISNMIVGASGRGTMRVSGGGVVAGGTNIGAVVSQNASSMGFVEIDGAGSQWTLGKDLTVGGAASGVMNVQGGGVVTCRDGTVSAGSGVSVVGMDSEWTAMGASLTVGGSLVVAGGGVCAGPSIVISTTGFVSGTLGTLQGAVANHGTLRPGVIAGNPALDLGSLAITGSYAQSGTGSLPIDINGLGFGATTHDSVAVTGAATLGGTITVSLIGGIEPAAGTAFDVLTASSVSGTFATETLQPLSGGKFLDVVYEATRVRVVVGTNCPADLDGDGTVGSADLALLLGAWGSTGGAADLDGSGTVGSGDLALLLGAWGVCP